MGDKILAELKGKVSKFAAEVKDVKADLYDFSGFEEEALEVLIVQLGYRRVEAENLIGKARARDNSIDSVESLLQSIFKHNASVENA